MLHFWTLKDFGEHTTYQTSDMFTCLRMDDDDWTEATRLPLPESAMEYRAQRSMLMIMRLILEKNPAIVQGAKWPESSDRIHGYHPEDSSLPCSHQIQKFAC